MSRVLKAAGLTMPYAARQATSTDYSVHFFRCLNNGRSLVDDVGGVVWTPQNAVLSYNETLKSYSTNMVGASLPEVTTGEFHTFSGDKASLHMIAARSVVGASTNIRYALGDNNGLIAGSNTGIGLVKGHCAITDNSEVLSAQNIMSPNTLGDGSAGTINVEGIDFFLVAIYEPGSGISHYDAYKISDGTALITSANNTGDLTIGDYQPYSALRFSGIELYMSVNYAFDTATVPTDWKLACWWMAEHASRGERYLWPGEGW